MKKKYWYIMNIDACPVCGREKKWRERVYEKPKQYFQWRDVYDWCDAL
jgi:hypothetical protein